MILYMCVCQYDTFENVGKTLLEGDQVTFFGVEECQLLLKVFLHAGQLHDVFGEVLNDLHVSLQVGTFLVECLTQLKILLEERLTR